MDLTTTNQVRTLYRALREIAEGSSYDLTLRQALVLLGVGGNPSPVNQQTLADQNDLMKPTISKIIAALAGTSGEIKREAGMGLLNVDFDKTDLRSRVVSLSRKGEALLTRAMKRGFGTA